MISQRDFNSALEQINSGFATINERLEKLEKEVKDADSKTKKGKSKG
tara:strand:- start:450 stop:590 length:141 start_codon:yes stop_codon:yes gene_type:complete